MNRNERRRRQALGGGAAVPPAGPGQAAALFSRAGAALQSGRFAEAEALFREVIAAAPGNADAENWLGVACQQQGKTAEALSHLRKAAALRPGSADFANNLGIVELAAENLDAAEAAFKKALALNPRLPTAHYNLGLVFQKRGAFDAAIASFEKAIALAPNYVNAHLNLGNALKDAGRREEAIAQYRKLAGLAPESREAHFNLGKALQESQHFAEAAAEMRRTLAIDPRCVEAHHSLGTVLTTLGQFDEAVASFQAALEIEPGNAQAIYGLTQATKAFSTGDMAARIDAALAAGPSQSDKSALHFALGKIYDDMGDYTRAFENYRIGNETAVPEAWFDPEIWTEFVERVVATFTPAYFAARKGWGSDSRRPVFIIGMPRSGTTLTEQIIASHPEVAPGGEMPTIPDLVAGLPERLGTESRFPESAAELDAGQMRDLCAAYHAALDAVDRSASRVTDKMPMNFQNLGLMAAMFPAATYIHCRRNPMDTCLSCYFQSFGRGLDYSYSFDNLAVYYRGYRRLMAHWREVLPVSMLEVDYEDMIANQEAASRRLIAHCGLPWDDRCLAFHKTERVVHTASVWQVRQPLYKSSVARWRRYEPFLEPLRAALGDAAD